MAMGKPVIANNGILEHEKVIEESKCGILVNYDEISFANAILKLYNKPEIGRKMGKNGYEWVLKHRTYEKIAIGLEKTYDKLIQKNKL
jgi:glycosyltransferase involved in cell wall biosynthesis